MNLTEKGHANERKKLYLHIHENLYCVLVKYKMKYKVKSLEIIWQKMSQLIALSLNVRVPRHLMKNSSIHGGGSCETDEHFKDPFSALAPLFFCPCLWSLLFLNKFFSHSSFNYPAVWCCHAERLWRPLPTPVVLLAFGRNRATFIWRTAQKLGLHLTEGSAYLK